MLYTIVLTTRSPAASGGRGNTRGYPLLIMYASGCEMKMDDHKGEADNGSGGDNDDDDDTHAGVEGEGGGDGHRGRRYGCF